MATNNDIRGAYLVVVNDVLVFDKKQAVTELQRLFDSRQRFRCYSLLRNVPHCPIFVRQLLNTPSRIYLT
jgi:hypothetical protein